MAAATGSPLNVRTRVSIWGVVVALGFACAFLLAGIIAQAAPLLPSRLGIFVEPPPWALGLAFVVFALFLFLVGVAELVRYISPSVEVIVDADGIATIGLLGERRFRWQDVADADVNDDLLSIRVRLTGRVRKPAMRIYFSRLDVAPADLVAAIRNRRPDLLR